HKPSSRHVLEELKGVSTSIPSALDVTPQSTATRIADDAPEQVVPRRSGRVVRQPEWFMGLGESSEAVPDVVESDPCSYNEALQDRDAESWQKAMKSEIESMDTNQMPPRREPDHQELPQATVVALFRDYHPEKFSGQGDPRVVDEWVQGLEIIFEVMNCPDRYRMLCAQIQLTGDARLWWQAYWTMRPGEKDGCTWDQFKELIREKYYPSYYRAYMERQFLALTQGTRTVDEYEREFTRLVAFVPDLVSTEAKRAHRFTDGLRPAVRHSIVGHGVQTYARAVAIAQEVDASIRREATQTPAQPVAEPPAQPKVAQPSTNQKKRKLRGGSDNRRTRPRQYPECLTCGKHHRGECLVGQN
ncbi:Unknown protein, partial [Striga hermonthica]